MKKLLLAVLLLLVASPLHAALAFDAEAGQQVANNASYTHTPVGTPRCVLVFVMYTGSSDDLTSVSYGGTGMTEVSSSPLIKATGETGVVHAYVLGASIPTGAQSVTSVAGAVTKRYRSITYTGAADCEVVATSTISVDTGADPSGTVSLGGRTSAVAEGWVDGNDSPVNVTELTNWTATTEGDFGTQTAAMYYYTIVSTTDVTFGYTALDNDHIILAVAVSEVLAGGTGTTGRILGGFIGR